MRASSTLPFRPRQRGRLAEIPPGCRKLGATQSMGRVGSCFNAVIEAFNSVLKVEYIHRHTFATRTGARIRIATWITDFYNARRLHNGGR